jgi:tRNA threonylcarbamoyladenosine biosynthesis protein TsaB
LIGIPTLDIVAASIGPEDIPLCAVLAAGRKRICAARYQWAEGEWRQEGELVNTTWEELLANLDTPMLFAGEVNEDGARRLRRLRTRAYRLTPAAGMRRAGFLAELGWERFRRNRVDDPGSLVPIYLSMLGTAGL